MSDVLNKACVLSERAEQTARRLRSEMATYHPLQVANPHVVALVEIVEGLALVVRELASQGGEGT